MRSPPKDHGPLFRWTPTGPTYLGRVLMDEAQWRVQSRANLTAKCPTCGQDTVDRIYSLAPPKVRALAILRSLCLREPTGWVHRTRVAALMPTATEMGGWFARLRYWGFVDPHPTQRGFWASTDQATAFLTGRIGVPAKIALREWTKTGKLLGFFAPLVTVGEVMKGEDFDLDALLDSARASLQVAVHVAP